MSEPLSETDLPAPDTSSPVLPETVEELLALGHRSLDEQNFHEAQRVFEKVLTLDPSHAAARHNLGYALERLGEAAEAEVAYTAALEGPAPLSQSAFNLGVLLANAGRESEARRAFEQALALNPHLSLAHVNVGVLHARAGRLEEARQCYQRALELDACCAAAQLKLAHLLLREGKWDEALHEYDRLLQEGVAGAAVHVGRGHAMAARDEEEGALQAFQQAVAVDPTSVPARIQLALLYAQRQDYEEALRTLQPVADAVQDDARFFYNLANMHARLAFREGELVNYGYADAAVREYRRAIAIDAHLLKAHYNLACVSAHLNVQDGIAAWEEYVRVASGATMEQEWVAKARGYLRRLKEIDTAR